MLGSTFSLLLVSTYVFLALTVLSVVSLVVSCIVGIVCQCRPPSSAEKAPLLPPPSFSTEASATSSEGADDHDRLVPCLSIQDEGKDVLSRRPSAQLLLRGRFWFCNCLGSAPFLLLFLVFLACTLGCFFGARSSLSSALNDNRLQLVVTRMTRVPSSNEEAIRQVELHAALDPDSVSPSLSRMPFLHFSWTVYPTGLSSRLHQNLTLSGPSVTLSANLTWLIGSLNLNLTNDTSSHSHFGLPLATVSLSLSASPWISSRTRDSFSLEKTTSNYVLAYGTNTIVLSPSQELSCEWTNATQKGSDAELVLRKPVNPRILAQKDDDVPVILASRACAESFFRAYGLTKSSGHLILRVEWVDYQDSDSVWLSVMPVDPAKAFDSVALSISGHTKKKRNETGGGRRGKEEDFKIEFPTLEFTESASLGGMTVSPSLRLDSSVSLELVSKKGEWQTIVFEVDGSLEASATVSYTVEVKKSIEGSKQIFKRYFEPIMVPLGEIVIPVTPYLKASLNWMGFLDGAVSVDLTETQSSSAYFRMVWERTGPTPRWGPPPGKFTGTGHYELSPSHSSNVAQVTCDAEITGGPELDFGLIVGGVPWICPELVLSADIALTITLSSDGGDVPCSCSKAPNTRASFQIPMHVFGELGWFGVHSEAVKLFYDFVEPFEDRCYPKGCLCKEETGSEGSMGE